MKKKLWQLFRDAFYLFVFGWFIFKTTDLFGGYRILWILWVSIGVALTYMIVGTIYTYKTLNKTKTEPETAN